MVVNLNVNLTYTRQPEFQARKGLCPQSLSFRSGTGNTLASRACLTLGRGRAGSTHLPPCLCKFLQPEDGSAKITIVSKGGRCNTTAGIVATANPPLPLSLNKKASEFGSLLHLRTFLLFQDIKKMKLNDQHFFRLSCTNWENPFLIRCPYAHLRPVLSY